MTRPPVVLVQANDAVNRPPQNELESIATVVSSLGGKSVPLSVIANLKFAPDVAIILGAGWPHWTDAMEQLPSSWRGTAFVCILTEQEAESQRVQNALADQLCDFMLMPVREPELRARISRLLRLAQRCNEETANHSFKAAHQLESLLGESEGFMQVLRRLPMLASVDATILITGETGTGKELVARALHYCGVRRNGPFVPCNCGALPDHLLENELFGHAPGAYTDARTEQKGLLAIAEGGTLFLDEIDGLSLAGQVKLLRLLQDREYRPLGSARTYHADIRIMAATNVQLVDLLKQRLFREDLFHRLNVLQVNLPPLRERIGDIEALSLAFLHRFAHQVNRPGLSLSGDAFCALRGYHWPGNVRELESVIQRAVVLAKSRMIEAAELELPNSAARPVSPGNFGVAKKQAVNGFEHSYLVQLLSESDGNVSRAALSAGKDRRSFQRLLRKYNLSPSDYHPH